MKSGASKSGGRCAAPCAPVRSARICWSSGSASARERHVASARRAGVASSCSTAMARSATLTVVPAVSALSATSRWSRPPPASAFLRRGGVPKGHRRRSLAEALARPRLIPHHLVVGEHLLDGRAGRQRRRVRRPRAPGIPGCSDNRRTGCAVRTCRRASGEQARRDREDGGSQPRAGHVAPPQSAACSRRARRCGRPPGSPGRSRRWLAA